MKFNDKIKVFGDVNYRNKKSPSESAEQITFFNEIRKTPLGAIAIHVRNEGKFTIGQVQKQKAEGMTTGAPDIIIPAKISFLCEMKRKDHTLSKWQKGQQEYLIAAQELGAFVCVALGHAAALEAVAEWRTIAGV